jgi:hypothetical protein
VYAAVATGADNDEGVGGLEAHVAVVGRRAFDVVNVERAAGLLGVPAARLTAVEGTRECLLPPTLPRGRAVTLSPHGKSSPERPDG